MDSLRPRPFSHDPSATEVFQALPEMQPSPADRPPRAVVIGGGTGASMAIRTALSMGLDTSAVVAMADDGGSTGILRDQAGATAPGDIRKCLTAMAADPEDPLVKAFKVRFGFAENHSLGNLMLSALEDTSGSFPEAIAICERLLAARGHVYPSTLDRVSLVAKTSDGRTLEGQAVASHSRTSLRKVALRSSEAVRGYGPAIEAITQADIVLLGPGSLFTSIIPNLLVPGISEALVQSPCQVVFVCSIADVQGETRGMDALDHYQALASHGLEGAIDWMLVQGAPADPSSPQAALVRYLVADDRQIAAIEAAGTKAVARDFIGGQNPSWHDPVRLREALGEVIAACPSIRM